MIPPVISPAAFTPLPGSRRSGFHKARVEPHCSGVCPVMKGRVSEVLLWSSERRGCCGDGGTACRRMYAPTMVVPASRGLARCVLRVLLMVRAKKTVVQCVVMMKVWE